MEVNKGILVFSYIFSSIGVLGVAYLYSSGNLITSVLSLLVFTPVVYILYKSINVQASDGGLYDQVRLFYPRISWVFVGFWVFSYYLYLTYTIYYITYYILPLSGLLFISATILSIAIIGLIAWFNLEVYSLIPITFLQILFLIPYFWHIKPFSLEVKSTTILSDALLPICITLVPFLGERLKGSTNLLYSAYAIASAFLITDSLFKPSEIVYYSTSLTSLGLILAEFFSIKNILIKRFNARRSSIIISFIVLSLLGLLNPSAYYNYLISVSLPSLYVSLSIFFISTFIYFKELRIKVLSIFSLSLMLYGLYTSILPQFLLIQILVLLSVGLISNFISIWELRGRKTGDK